MTISQNDRKEDLDRIVTSLVKVYSPEAIYIFGSYAWGEPTDESDIDLAVIIDHSDLGMAERIRLSSSELWDIQVPTDILVYTREEMEEKAKYNSTLQHRIMTEGKIVYEAA